MSKTVVLNGSRINYDNHMDYYSLDQEVVVYEDSKEEDILERVQGFDIVVTKELKLSKEMILSFPSDVKMILEAGTGYNNIDLDAAKEKDILVCNIPAYSSKRVAHTAIMGILNLSSGMQKQIRMIERKDYRNFSEHLMVEHVEVNDKVLGIIGAGNIGKEVIKIAKALDMKVLVYTRTPREDEENVHYTSLEEVLTQSDYISLHCPLNEKTHHLINSETLSLMKSSAFLINTSRGPLIDEEALIQALKEKRIAGAYLDVQEIEPLREDSELFELENVIVTPHMGWKGYETRQRLLGLMKDTIQAYRNNEPIHVVSK